MENKEVGKCAKTTNALHNILDRLINPEFQSYGLLYFTSTLKPKWQYDSFP